MLLHITKFIYKYTQWQTQQSPCETALMFTDPRVQKELTYSGKLKVIISLVNYNNLVSSSFSRYSQWESRMKNDNEVGC